MSIQFISQSEADMFLACQKKHFYAFGEPCVDGSRGIAPTTHSDSLNRGNIGHKIFEDFYSALIEGDSWVDARRKAVLLHTNRASIDTDNMLLYSQITNLFVAYTDHYETDMSTYEPLAVEQEFRYPIPGTELVFPFKPDLVVRHKITGKIEVWDHKFVYNFYGDRTISIMPQLAKYCRALKLLGYDVDGAMYNQITTRNNARQLFRRTPADVGESKQIQFFDEQIAAMKRIAYAKTLPTEVMREGALRTASHFNCNNCQFLDLCSMDLSGANGRSLHIAQFYEPNKYGYGKEDDE